MKNFFKNLKQYLDYLMKVNFKDLLVNIIILCCIVLLSIFVYLPIGLIEDLIRSFIVVWRPLVGIPAVLFTWFFSLLSFIGAVIAFMYLFNKRFEDIEAFKNQLGNKDNKNISTDIKKKESEIIEEIDLPKQKDEKKGA